MTDAVLIGRGETISRIPQANWEQELRSAPEGIRQRLAFMSEEHHLVRNFVVQELPRLGRPIPLSAISHALGISRTQTSAIVDDLERNLFFLVRPGGEQVSWAFPVTVEETGHQLVFSTGDRLNAA
jgi:hypothetical protein